MPLNRLLTPEPSELAEPCSHLCLKLEDHASRHTLVTGVSTEVRGEEISASLKVLTLLIE